MSVDVGSQTWYPHSGLEAVDLLAALDLMEHCSVQIQIHHNHGEGLTEQGTGSYHPSFPPPHPMTFCDEVVAVAADAAGVGAVDKLVVGGLEQHPGSDRGCADADTEGG